MQEETECGVAVAMHSDSAGFLHSCFGKKDQHLSLEDISPSLLLVEQAYVLPGSIVEKNKQNGPA